MTVHTTRLDFDSWVICDESSLNFDRYVVKSLIRTAIKKIYYNNIEGALLLTHTFLKS